jgi:hypothetical protein
MALGAFAPPGNVTDLTPAGRRRWSTDLDALIAREAQGDPADGPRRQFFSPLGVDLAADAATRDLRWGAFPRKLARLPAPLRWQLAEERDRQEEYCEWSGVRDRKGRLLRALFTTEVPSYYHLLARDDPKALLAVYRDAVSPQVKLSDLVSSTGFYRERNPWNLTGAMHMIQPNNTLGAAVVLVAEATVVRDGVAGRLTNANDLIRCGVAADADRNSDPLIVSEINALARRKADVTLADPVGLYLDNLSTAGWATPDGTDPQTFWTLTRGDAGHGVRAVFEVPDALGYSIADVTINGQTIVSPSQIAEGIEVRITGVAHRFGKSTAAARPCAGAGPAPAVLGAGHAGGAGLGAAPRELPSIEELIAGARNTR